MIGQLKHGGVQQYCFLSPHENSFLRMTSASQFCFQQAIDEDT